MQLTVAGGGLALVILAATFAAGYDSLSRRTARLELARPVLSNDAYLGLPTVVMQPDQQSYAPKFTRSHIRYMGNFFHADRPDEILTTRRLTPADHEILWSSGIPLAAGDELEIVGNEFHDLRVATTFVKVRRISDAAVGYISMETFVGETTPIDVPKLSDGYALTASTGGINVMLPFVVDADSTAASVKALDGVSLHDILSAPISAGAIHPVMAGNRTAVLLHGMLMISAEDEMRQKGLEAVKRIFDEYAFPAKIEVAPGAIAWPNTYDFPLAWGGKLKAPWFSAYSNGVFAASSAQMFRITGEQRYADLARQAVAWMRLPTSKGGALYHDGAFSFVAEYPASPQVPSIRIFDGELVAVISIYNTAVLLQDDDMLRFAAQLAYSLVNQIDLFTTKDNRIQNGRYQWLIDSPSYIVPMKRWAAQLGMITKDQRFFDAAERWRISDVYWPAAN